MLPTPTPLLPRQNLPKLEHSVVIIVQIISECGGLDVELPSEDDLLAGLEELEPAVPGVVDRPPGLPHLAESGSGHGEHGDGAWGGE